MCICLKISCVYKNIYIAIFIKSIFADIIEEKYIEKIYIYQQNLYIPSLIDFY